MEIKVGNKYIDADEKVVVVFGDLRDVSVVSALQDIHYYYEGDGDICSRSGSSFRVYFAEYTPKPCVGKKVTIDGVEYTLT